MIAKRTTEFSIFDIPSP